MSRPKWEDVKTAKEWMTQQPEDDAKEQIRTLMQSAWYDGYDRGQPKTNADLD